MAQSAHNQHTSSKTSKQTPTPQQPIQQQPLPDADHLMGILQRAEMGTQYIEPQEASILQQTIGNRAMGRLESSNIQRKFSGPRDRPHTAKGSIRGILDRASQISDIAHESVIQAKLKLGPVGDNYEREADAVAQQVVDAIATRETASSDPAGDVTGNKSGPSLSPLQRKEEEELQSLSAAPILQKQDDEELQAKVDPMLAGGELSSEISNAVQRAKSGGQAIADPVRKPMEQAFNSDFSRVRIHTNNEADRLNRSISARAFTTGKDIFFRSGEYNPDANDGQILLAHELAHTVQQAGGSPQSVQAAADETIQRAMISVGDVSAKTRLRERPDVSSPKRSGNIEVAKNVLKIDNPDQVVPDEGGLGKNWVEAEVIAGEQIGFAGFLRQEKYRPASGPNGPLINEDRLGYVTSKTKLRAHPTEDKEGPALVPGDMFVLRDRATEDVPFAQVRIITGNGRNQNGWLREGKLLMRSDPLVPDTFEVQDLTEAEARTAPDTLGDAPIVASEDTSKAALLAALDDLDLKYKYIEYEVEKGGKVAQAVGYALARIETFFTTEATAKQRLKRSAAEEAGREEAQSLAEDSAFKIMSDAALMKKEIIGARNTLNQDVSQSSLDRVEAVLNLISGRERYEAAVGKYEKVRENYDRLVSGDADTNPVIEQALETARKVSSATDKQGVEWFGGDLIGYSSESIGDASSEGGEASISGLAGARSTVGSTNDGSDARITGAMDQYDDEGELKDAQSRQGYNPLDEGAFALGSEEYADFASEQSSVVQNVAKWMKGLGFLQDLSVTKEGISATVTKLSIIKPFPPLASVLLAIPLYPGVGVKLEAKAKASVSLSASIAVNWGDWLTSGSANKSKLDALYSKQKTAKGKETLLKIKLRDGEVAEQETARGEYPTVAKEISTLEGHIAQQQKQLSMWSRDMTLKVQGQGKIRAMIGGEFFGGIFLGIPVANVSGGLYGEIAANAGATLGIEGIFQRKDEKWFKRANLGFDVSGGLTAEVGAKIGYQILFFSGDIAKFKFGDWSIASFYVRGNKGLGEKANPLASPDGIEKKVTWGSGPPPIETQVEQAKDRAEESVGGVREGIGERLSEEDESSYHEIHSALAPEGAAAQLGAQLEELRSKKETLAGMEEAAEQLPESVEISGAKQRQMDQLRVDIDELEETLAEVRDTLDSDMGEMDELLATMAQKHGSIFKSKHTLQEKARKDVGSFRTLSDTYFNQARRSSFSVSRQMVIFKKKHDEAKVALEAYVGLNRAGVDDYITLERLVEKKEKAVGAQKQTIKDLEQRRSKIKSRKEGGKSHRASAEFSRQKNAELAQVNAKLTPAKEKLTGYERVLTELKARKTRVRKANLDNVKEYKRLRDDLAKAKTQYDAIIEKLDDLNSQMLKARSFAEQANIMDAELVQYSQKIEEVRRYKQLVTELELILSAEE